MCDIEPVNRITDGMASYLPISHGRSAVEELSFDEFGLMHTGQLGDVIIGSYLTSNDYGTPRFTKGSSYRFIQKLPQNSLQQHDNLELFLFQNRGFNYILTGNLPIQRYTEVCSPFLDLDFLNFCMSVPLKFRINHRLYKKWILQKYPGAAKYVWERLGTYITTPTISIRKKSVAYTKLPAFVLKGILHNLGIIDSKKLEGTRNMNPFQYWYETKKEISSEMESFFAENIELVSDPEIRKDCGYLYKKGNIQEKSQVLTLLASIKHFFT